MLVKTRSQLLERIAMVRPYVRSVHIDVMDGMFVPNTTVPLSEMFPLPEGVRYEFHWMVKDPAEWISKSPKGALHLVHVETIREWAEIKAAAERVQGEIGLVFNPETPLDSVRPYVGRVRRFLAMSVNPGFDGQKYMRGVESKIRELRGLDPSAEIEVDGGINKDTAPSAVSAGANVLAAASAIFAAPDIATAISLLKGGRAAGGAGDG